MNERWPNFVVVIPTIGQKKEISTVIEFLNSNFIKFWLVEQKSLDLQSTLDGSLGLNQLNHVKIFDAFGASRARNVGLNLLDSNIQYVMFINDSTLPDLNFINQSLHYMSRFQKLGAIVGNYSFANGSLKMSSGNHKLIFAEGFTPWDCFNAMESAVIWNVKYIKSVQGFDEDIGTGSGTLIGSMEATDLLLRTMKSGAIVAGTNLVAGCDLRNIPNHKFITDLKYGIGFSVVARRHGFFLSALIRVPVPIFRKLLSKRKADSPESFLGNVAVSFGRFIGLFVSNRK
jgi:hypothetical protein